MSFERLTTLFCPNKLQVTLRLSKCGLIFFLGFCSSICSAQQISRTFLPVNPKAEKVKVLANVQSTYLIKTKSDLSMEVIAFDDDLKELWGIGITLKYPVLHVAEVYNEGLALLMSNTRRRKFVLLEIEAENGHYSFSEYSLSTAFQGLELARFHETYWVRGMIGEEPVAFRLDDNSQTLKTLPVGYANPISGISHFAFDPINEELDMLLEVNENGYQAYLLRSIDLKGDITRNLLLSHPNRHITDLRFNKTESGKLEAIGALAKKKLVLGLAHFVKDASGLSIKEWAWKDFQGLDETLVLENEAITSKSSKGLKSLEAEIDDVSFMPDGEVIVSLETFEKDYEVRGLLQRESDEQSMVDQIDLNRYGRRDFDTNETTLNDRVDNFSNTEAATYRFRDVIIDRLQEQGNRHSQTTILKVTEDGNTGIHMKMPPKVNSNFSIPELNQVLRSYWLVNEHGINQIRWVNEPELLKYDMSLGPYLQRINHREFLNYGFLLQDKVFYLMIQRLDFEESSD